MQSTKILKRSSVKRIKMANRIHTVSDDYGTQPQRSSFTQMKNRRLSLPTKQATIYPIDPQLKRNMEELKFVLMRKHSVDQSIQSNVNYFPKYDIQGKHVHKHRTYDVRQALFALQHLTRHSAEYPSQSGNEHKYMKDYIQVSLDYKSYEPYRVNNPVNQIRCLLCTNVAEKSTDHSNSHRRTVSKVFFPCEHLCVCDTCYDLQRMWTICPLCNSDVKLIVRLSGNEKEEYLKWVEEIKPELPYDFTQEFTKKSRQAIAEAMRRSIEGHISVHENEDQTDQENEPIHDEFEELETFRDRFCNIL